MDAVLNVDDRKSSLNNSNEINNKQIRNDNL